MSRKYLLGATINNEIVFGEFGVTNRNGYPEFTACFNTVSPFKASELEDVSDYYEDLLENCYDDAHKFKLCKEYDCAPSELAEHLAEENGSDPMDIKDCSIFPECYNIDGEEWYFESQSGGQHDTRDEMSEYVNRSAYDDLHILWDNYHLKKVDLEVEEAVKRLEFELTKVNVEDWITEYIQNNLE